MCGIAGILHLNGQGTSDPSDIKRMADVMEHRGPDDEGFFVSGPIQLAHRRLSIIDLNSGHQPMFNEDESIAIVFKNGQIRKRRIDALRGSPQSPLSDEELLAKLSDCMSWGRSAVRPADLLEATQRLGTTSIRDLIAMIERPNLSAQEVQ